MTIPSLVLTVSLGIGALERGAVEFRPGPEESSVPERFRLERAVFSYELEPVLSTANYTVSRLRFPSPVTTAEPENNMVHAEYFAPSDRTRRHPAVIVLHILGADFPLSRYLAARLADRGVAALFLKLPYYGERRPARGGLNSQRFLSADVPRTVTAMRQGICDVRRAACWLSGRPEIDPTRLGAAGISLGGIVAAVAVAVDPALHEGAFLLAGGDLSRILWTMPEGASFRAWWTASGWTVHDLKVLTDPFDPLTYAPRLAGKRILMMAGKVDEVIPPASAQLLWEAAGRPPIRWFDCGHYSAVGFLLPGIRQTVEFFAAPERPRARSAPPTRPARFRLSEIPIGGSLDGNTHRTGDFR
jgi:dienelactone hydrolase